MTALRSCGLKSRAKRFCSIQAGGLKKAALFSSKISGDSDEPFILHNVDVISTIDIDRMVQFHRQNRALATLAVQQRDSSRYLLFDALNQLCGRRNGRDQAAEIVRIFGTDAGAGIFLACM